MSEVEKLRYEKRATCRKCANGPCVCPENPAAAGPLDVQIYTLQVLDAAINDWQGDEPTVTAVRNGLEHLRARLVDAWAIGASRADD